MVEARAMGRHGLGTDISQLAEFVSKVKTSIMEKKEVQVIQRWVAEACSAINVHRPSNWPAAGSVDTELRCLMELEVCDGETEVQPRVQA